MRKNVQDATIIFLKNFSHISKCISFVIIFHMDTCKKYVSALWYES